MRNRQMASALWIAAFLVGTAQAQWWVGTDVKLGQLSSLSQPSGSHTGTYPNGMAGLTMATTSCNEGTVPVPWWSIYGDAGASPPKECPDDPPSGMSECHPSIGMELYRLRDGRLQEIGMSWLKHGWFALSSNQCGSPGCQGDPSGNHLGVGCSDTYSTGNNAARDDLGPRSEWNPYTNEWEACGSHFDVNNDCVRTTHSHGEIDHRVRVADADLNNPGASYYYQGIYYVKYEETLWDNIGWHPVTSMSWTGSRWTFSAPGGTPTSYGPVIYAWDPNAVEVNTGEGLAYAGVQVTQLGDSTWHYEYAVYNCTSNIPFWSFSVPIPVAAQPTNVGFYDIDDPEEPYNMDDWSWQAGNGILTWYGETYQQNPNANALRFGRQYNFWFDLDAPPVEGLASLGLFLPGADDEMQVPMQVPDAGDSVAPFIESSDPFTGYIDPRRETDDGVNVNQGLTEVTVVFSEPVRDIGGAPLSAGAFVLTVTGGTNPGIDHIDASGNPTVVVYFGDIIPLQEWTTLEANVEDMAGNEIEDLGNRGPVDETDRVDVAFLPGDMSQDGWVAPLDLTLFRGMYAGQITPPRGTVLDYADINRDGSIFPIDLTLFRSLYVGGGTSTRQWQGERLNNDRP